MFSPQLSFSHFPDSLMFIKVCLLLGRPQLGMLFQMWSYKCQIITFLHLLVIFWQHSLMCGQSCSPCFPAGSLGPLCRTAQQLFGPQPVLMDFSILNTGLCICLCSSMRFLSAQTCSFSRSPAYQALLPVCSYEPQLRV